MQEYESHPAEQMMRMIVGKWISKPIYAAAELGLADLLADGPMSVEDLARRSGTRAPALFRLLRALAGLGIFAETEGRCFRLTPLAECLKTGALRSAAVLFNAEWSDRAWGSLLDGLKTDAIPFETAMGRSLTDWLKANPSAARIFNEANAVKAADSHRGIAEAYDFSETRTLTDLGGGTGRLMVEVLQAHPALRGTVAELPSVAAQARQYLRSRGFDRRCRVVECDIFKNIPEGSDAYLLSNILHDWPDDRVRLILGNCRSAMRARSKLLVIEMVVPPGNAPSVSKLLDLEMLVMTGGRERTEGEFRALLKASGLRLTRVISLKGETRILEAATDPGAGTP